MSGVMAILDDMCKFYLQASRSDPFWLEFGSLVFLLVTLGVGYIEV